MQKNNEKRTLESKLLISFILAFSFLLIITFFITLSLNIKHQNEAIDSTISNLASYISSMDGVKAMLKRGYPDTQVSRALDGYRENFDNLDIILIQNSAGMRFYHTKRLVAGDSFVAGEEQAILDGAAPYITSGYGTNGQQRCAFHPIIDDEGEIIGFVMTSVFTSDILARNRGLVISYLFILCTVFLIGLFLSHGIVRLLRSSLMGYHPLDLLDLYLQQADVLNAVEDGMVATDMDGNIVFLNHAAQELFQTQQEQVKGQRLFKLFPDTTCQDVSLSGQGVYNCSHMIAARQVLVSEIPLGEKGKGIGTLSIFHDKTEMLKLSDELSGTQYMLDTLRFFNHEFMNKLHIILGYLQGDEIDKAKQFIVNSSLVSSQAIRETANCIRVSRLCALLIGKMMYAAELGILLTVKSDSFCTKDDLLLSLEDCVTVVGNLLENAIEELTSCQSDLKEIKIGIYCQPNCNIIICEDTGGGIKDEIRETMFEKDATTKGKQRGLGLSLIAEILEKNHGESHVETEPEAGTCFTLTFTKGGTRDVPSCDY